MKESLKFLKVVLLTVILTIIGFAFGNSFRIKAADYYVGNQDTSAMPSTWEGLKTANISDSSSYVKLNVSGGAQAYNGTFNAYLMMEKDVRYGYKSGDYWDGSGLLIENDSRMVFDTKIKVEAGTVLSVVGATSDSATGGGKNVNDGYSFYWTVMEYDENGYAIYDGDWRDTTQTWTVGYEENVLEGDEISRAPSYKGDGGKTWRSEDVAYVMIVIRIASGDKTQGAGQDLVLSREVVAGKFPNMYVVGTPFQYVFQANGGTVEGGTRTTLRRMGITPYLYDASKEIVTSELIKLPFAVRTGYDFKGWKVTSASGKGLQDGNIYMQDGSFIYDSNGGEYGGEGDILSNGKFYSSLFDLEGTTSFVAQWEATEYDITYDLQGGMESVPNPTSYTIETPSFVLKNPIKAGYTFKGWTGSNGSAEQTSVSVVKGTTGNLTFKANWEISETDVTVNHYIMEVNGDFPVTPNKTNTVKLAVGQSFKEDYGVEYFKDSSLEQAGAIEFSGYEFPSSGIVSSVSGENVIKIYYSRKVYTVTFNVAYNGGWWNDGFVDREDIKVMYRYGARVDLNSLVVTRGASGWEFLGWSNEEDGRIGLTMYTVASDVTLYAQFRGNVIVGFTDAKGREEIVLTLYNREVSKEMRVPYLDEYNTWNDVDGSLGVGWTSEIDVDAPGGIKSTLTPGGIVYWGVSSEYYGIYKGYATVSFDENGGDETYDTKDRIISVYRNSGNLSKTKNGEVTLPDCLRDKSYNDDGTIISYEIGGWWFDGAVYPVGGIVGVTGSTEFVAQWNSATTNIKYTIVFNMNGGKNGPESVEVRYGDEIVLPNKGSRVGFTLKEWCTTPDGSGTGFKPGATVKNLTNINGATVILYAQWKRRDFVLVKVSSSRYGATFIRRMENDQEWFNSTGKITIDEWTDMTEQQKNYISMQRWHITKDGNVTRIK